MFNVETLEEIAAALRSKETLQQDVAGLRAELHRLEVAIGDKQREVDAASHNLTDHHARVEVKRGELGQIQAEVDELRKVRQDEQARLASARAAVADLQVRFRELTR